MSKLNDLQTLILHTLQSSAMTGYDMLKLLDNNAVWKASHQQIYRELKKLLKNGLLIVEEVPQDGKPDKRVYALSDEGYLLAASLSEFSAFKPRTLRHVSATMLQVGSVGYFVMMIEKLRDMIESLEEKCINSTAQVRLVIKRDIQVLKADLDFAQAALNNIEKTGSLL